MKKVSKPLSLVLMSSLTMALGGCGSEEATEEFRAYNSVDACVREQIFTPEECRDMAVAAVAQNPKFTDKAECEREFGEGNCSQPENLQAENLQADKQGGQSSQGSLWMPLLAGYMAGRFLGGGGMMQGAQPLYTQPGSAQPQGGAGARASGGFAGSYRTLGGGTVQADAAGKVAPTQNLRQGFAKSAKPYAGRIGGGSRGGFSGSKGFGSAAS